MQKVGILTLGCKVNQYESAAIAEELANRGYEICGTDEKCDFYIINTCTVTSEADKKSRQMIRRLIKANKEAKVIVTGCYAQINAEKIMEIDGVDCVIGTRNKMETVQAVENFVASQKDRNTKLSNFDTDGFEQMLLSGMYGGGTEERTRAYIKIQDGCDSHCTYCIIPKARGPICSKAPEDVIKEVTNLAEKGYLEVVLTGIETAAYGRDFQDKYSLADLLEEVNKIDKIKRIRLGSLDPSLLTPEFVSRIAKLEKLTPHFHISLQSGCDRILALMKRKYNTKMLFSYMNNIRKSIPDVMFTTDIICGFPSESEEDFAQTQEFVKQAGFLSAHIFPYSKRKGTPAAEMSEQIPHIIASERVAKLYATVNEKAREILKPYNSRIMSVIPEGFKDGIATAHTASFIPVKIKCTAEKYEEIHAKIVDVRLSVNNTDVFGDLI